MKPVFVGIPCRIVIMTAQGRAARTRRIFMMIVTTARERTASGSRLNNQVDRLEHAVDWRNLDSQISCDVIRWSVLGEAGMDDAPLL